MMLGLWPLTLAIPTLGMGLLDQVLELVWMEMG